MRRKFIFWRTKIQISVSLLLFFSLLALLIQFLSDGSTSEGVSLAAAVQGSPTYCVYLPLLSGGGAIAPSSATPQPLLRPSADTFAPCPATGAMSDGLPSWGAPIAISPLDERVWVVNPDAGSVTVIDSTLLEKVVEIKIGEEPWSLAISPNGHVVYVVDRANGTLVVVDALSLVVSATLPIGPELGAIALNPTGTSAYVTVTLADQVAVVDTSSRSVIARIPVASKPYGIAVTDDGDAFDDDEQVIVTHFLAFQRPDGVEATDDGREGRVSVLDAGTNLELKQIALLPDEHGFPNLLAGVAIAGSRAWIPQVRAAPDLPVGLTTTVFAAVSSLDLTLQAEDVAAHLPLNDEEIFGSPVNNPLAAIPSPDGERLYVVLAGSDLASVVDVSDPHQPRLVRFLAVGKNPRGMALSRDGRRGYVMNYLSRTVTVLDLEELQAISELSVTDETLKKEVLNGKIRSGAKVTLRYQVAG